MIKIRTSGYQSKSLSADITLGIFDGLENSLWCYAFAIEYQEDLFLELK